MTKRKCGNPNGKNTYLDYNRPNKNRVREKVIQLISKYNPERILTLESPAYEIANSFKDKEVIVYETEFKTYKFLKENKPKNVKLKKGDVKQFSQEKDKADVIYLDFCKTLTGEKETISELKEKLTSARLLIFTFSPREVRQKDIPQFELSVIGRLQKLLNMDLRVVYGETYRDYPHSPMVTFAVEPKVYK